jgi:hypothetical protein
VEKRPEKFFLTILTKKKINKLLEDIWSNKFFKECDENDIESLRNEVVKKWEKEGLSKIHNEIGKKFFDIDESRSFVGD